jgi:hypothetical protein
MGIPTWNHAMSDPALARFENVPGCARGMVGGELNE